jgi:hypothetical protein
MVPSPGAYRSNVDELLFNICAANQFRASFAYLPEGPVDTWMPLTL